MDADAYARALRPLLTRAGGYARAMLGHRADAEDAVQQAALRGFERIGGYDPSRPFASWWFAILRNCCIDLLRRRRPPDLPLDGRDAPAPVGADADSLDLDLLAKALAALPEPHREILRLRYHAELSYAELAETLAVPKGTVMSRLHAARRALARAIGEEEVR